MAERVVAIETRRILTLYGLSEMPGSKPKDAWSPQAKKWVTHWQEYEYGKLAERIGLGWRPEEMFERLTAEVRPPTLRDYLDSFPDGSFTQRDRAQAQLDFDSFVAAYYNAEPETPFTEPGQQSGYNFDAHVGELAIAATPWRLAYRPRLATLPLGDYNARSRRIPGTDEVAVMFDLGLRAYLNGFAQVVAADFPRAWWWRSDPRMGSESQARADRKRAAAYLGDVLVAYVQHGSPDIAVPPKLSVGTQRLAGTVWAAMLQFVVCHELAHLCRDHLAVSKSSSPYVLHELEYTADYLGAKLAAADVKSRESQVLIMWCALLALQAFRFLERALWYMATGQRQELPASRTHPMPQWRAKRLLHEMTVVLWDAGRIDEANALGSRSVDGAERLETLWLAAEQRIDKLREQGAGPAALWQPRLALARRSEGKPDE